MVNLLNILERFLHVATVALQVLLAAVLLLSALMAAEVVHVLYRRRAHRSPPPITGYDSHIRKAA